MNICNYKIIIFGGTGEYIKRLKTREIFNDVWTISVTNKTWTNLSLDLSILNESMPMPRMQHASVIVNNSLLVYGGINDESKQYLNNFALYDFDANDWVPVIVTPQNEEVNLGKLAMHSMT